MSRKKHNAPVVIVLLLILAVLIFVLFPRKYMLTDGGTVIYGSFPVAVIYSVEDRHALCSENGTTYYEIGTVVKFFGIEVYNDAHIDYDHPQGTAEQVNEAIESFSAAMGENG